MRGGRRIAGLIELHAALDQAKQKPRVYEKCSNACREVKISSVYPRSGRKPILTTH